MNRLLILVAAACLSGCAAAVPVLTVMGTGASVYSVVQTADTDADALLAADAPVKHAICDIENPSPTTQAKFRAWCDHIATTVSGLAVQWAAVAAAP